VSGGVAAVVCEPQSRTTAGCWSPRRVRDARTAAPRQGGPSSPAASCRSPAHARALIAHEHEPNHERRARRQGAPR